MMAVICIQIKRGAAALSEAIKQIALFDRCICLFILIYLNKLTPRGLLSMINHERFSVFIVACYIYTVKHRHMLKPI